VPPEAECFEVLWSQTEKERTFCKSNLGSRQDWFLQSPCYLIWLVFRHF
jgi:hypothetical protein